MSLRPSLPPVAELLQHTAFANDAIVRGARTFESALECLDFADVSAVARARRWFGFYCRTVARHHDEQDRAVFAQLARVVPHASARLGALGVVHDELALAAAHVEAALAQLAAAREPDARAEFAGAARLHATTLRAALEAHARDEQSALAALLEAPGSVRLAGRATSAHRACDGDPFARFAQQLAEGPARDDGDDEPARDEPAVSSSARGPAPASVRAAWRARRRRLREALPLLPARVPELPHTTLPSISPRAA